MRGYVDRIKIQEEQTRLKLLEDSMRAGAHAAEALLWFGEYGNAGPKKAARFEPPITVTAQLNTASAVSGFAAAQSFVAAVAKEFAAEILDRAITLAQDRYERAEIARRDFDKAQKDRKP